MEHYQAERDYLRAQQLMVQQRWTEAERLFAMLATTAMRDESYVHYEWAFAVLQTGNQKRAEEMALGAIKMFPEEECLHLLLGQIARQKDQTRRAIRHFEDALRIDPEHCDVLAYYALAQCDAENFRKAEQALKASLNIDPEHKMSLVAQAELLRLTERNKEASEVLKSTLRLNPESSIVHSVTANNAFDSGNYNEAAQYYREALRLNPSSEQARNMLLLCLKGRFWAFRWHLSIQRKLGKLPTAVRVLILLLLFFLSGGILILYVLFGFVVGPVSEVLLSLKPENRFLFSPERRKGLFWAKWGVGLMALSLALIPFFMLVGAGWQGSFCLGLLINGALLTATALKAFESRMGAFWAITAVCCLFSSAYVAAFLLAEASFTPAFFMLLVYLWFRD